MASFLKNNPLIVLIVIIVLGLFSFIFVASGRNSKEDNTTVEYEDYEIEILEPSPAVSCNEFVYNSLSETEDFKAFDSQINKFIKRWEIQGASLAVMKDEQLVYAKGYGWSDREEETEMEANNIMRIASLSKLITAAGILKLQEDSLLSISDKVFGDGGILDLPQFQNITDKRILNITVDQLLRHKAGFTMHRGDPLFTTREIIIWDKLDSVPDMDGIIEHVLRQKLGYAPGTSSRYSNVGYLILTKIIEQASGVSYYDYITDNILIPAKCYDMHLAKNLYEDRYPNEVRYYETHTATPIPAYDNCGEYLPRCYGGNNIEGLLGAGGWVASSIEMARFIAAIDGNDGISDILGKESLKIMFDRSNGQGPIGWVRGTLKSDWVRTGTLAGTSAVIKRKQNGYTWIFITNSSSWKGAKFPKYIESMMNNALSKVKEWPERDLFNATI